MSSNSFSHVNNRNTSIKNLPLLVSDPSPVFFLPETLSIVFFFLSQYTLSHTIRYVCKQWLMVVRPMIKLRMLWKTNPHQIFNHEFLLTRLHLVSELRIVINEHDDRTNWIRTCKLLSRKLESLATLNQLHISKMVLFNLGSLSDMMNLVLPQNSMTEVRILWKTSYTTSLGILLTLCPMIRRLHIEGCSGYSRFIEESVEPWHSTSVKPKESGIKYLVVNWMCIESNRLEAILGRCPQLETLKLIKIFSSSSYGSSLYRTRIFNAVAVSCPQLKRFHLSIFDRFMTAVNISPWSNLYSWEFSQSIPIHVGQETIGQDQNGIQSQQLLLDTVSVLDRDINKATVSAIFAPILDTSFEKIITTLEIIPTNNFNHYDYIGDALHTFLCSAPSLVHLLAPGVHCYVDYLNLHDMSLAVDASSFGFSQERNSEFIVRNRRRATWACRGLKTLQIKFMSRNFVDSATPRNSRIMFGYIATVCPNLVELYIDRQSLNLKLEGGFCLLSRLQYLQKLIIQTRTVTKLEMEDISWMSHYPLLESNSVTETKLRSRVYAKLCSKLTFLKRGPRPLNKKDIMDGARKVSEKAKGAEDFEDFGSMENLRECLLSLTEQQGTEGKNCWPQLEFLGLSLYLLHKKEIVHLEKYLPIMISQLRPGVEFSCNSHFWPIPNYRLLRGTISL